MVHAGDDATAVLDMRRAAASAARGSSRGLVSVRAMTLFSAVSVAFDCNVARSGRPSDAHGARC
jgi:hypothetical protein